MVELIPTSSGVFILATTTQKIKPDNVTTRVFITRKRVSLKRRLVISSFVLAEITASRLDRLLLGWGLS